MKSFILIIFLKCFYLNILIAQLEPSFLTKFYFQDAIGNKDSMEIGFDSRVQKSPKLDFGETIDRSSFDSIFDIRAVNYFEFFLDRVYPPNLKKYRIVGDAEKIMNSNCLGGEFLTFFIHARFQPITISWKEKDFEVISCPGKVWHFFTPDATNHFIDPINWAMKPRTRYGCMRDSSYTVYLSKDSIRSGERPYELYYEIEGKGLDTIYGVTFIMDHTFFICSDNYNAVDNLNASLEFELFPNPTLDFVHLKVHQDVKIRSIQIFNSSADLVHSIITNPSIDPKMDISIEEFPAGLYYFVLQDIQGRRVCKKLIKM